MHQQSQQAQQDVLLTNVLDEFAVDARSRAITTMQHALCRQAATFCLLDWLESRLAAHVPDFGQRPSFKCATAIATHVSDYGN